MEAKKLIKDYSWMFTIEDQIDNLNKIKEFYNTNGYVYEQRKVFKDLIMLLSQSKYHDSIELAMCYHDIGYTFERYRYYRLMLKAMIRSSEILDKSKVDSEKKDSNMWANNAAFIYTSLGYAY